jgi:hypothetical protein
MHRLVQVLGQRSWPSTITARRQINLSYERSVTKLSYLLEQQLGRVRDRQLRHLLRALTIRTPSVVPHQSTFLARVHLELVRGNHESFEE